MLVPPGMSRDKCHGGNLQKETAMFHSMRRSLLAAIVSIAAFGIGCAKGPAPEQTKTVDSLQGVISNLDSGMVEVNKLISSIDQLQSGGNVKEAFGQFNTAAAAIKEAGDNVRNRAKSFNESQEAYIKKWQAELDTVQDPAVRASLQQRKEKIASAFSQIQADAAAVRDLYIPLLNQTSEIQRLLALDLTPAGVNAMKPALDAAKANAVALNSKIAALRGTLVSIGGSMGAPAPK